MNNKDEKLAPNERASWVAKLVAQGIKGQELAKIIVANKTRQEIWDELILYSRNIKKNG